jgi:hypothetical protein
MIVGNNIGISFVEDQNNLIYHNNFESNGVSANFWTFSARVEINAWDNGYPSGGNYWSDYTGEDANSDGIGDIPYFVLNTAPGHPPVNPTDNMDHYPLMNPWSPAPANQPPSAPVLSGPTLCTLYDEHDVYQGPWKYTASASDPDGNKVKILFSWDDGSPDTLSGETDSGQPVTVEHRWVELLPTQFQTGMHKVRAKAIDIHGAESDWSSPLEVTVIAEERYDKYWSGYLIESALATNPITSVSGGWIEPTFHVPNGGSYQSTWVGIGGLPGKRLLQAGITEMKIWKIFSNRPAMLPFWEIVDEKGDGPPATIDFFKTADPGDEITTSISADNANPGYWNIQVTDVTKPWTFSASVQYNPDTTTAEWIHELGAKNSGIASFDPIQFSKAEFDTNTVNHKVGEPETDLKFLYRYDCMKSGTVYTTVSSLTEYQEFSISYTGTSPKAASVSAAVSLHSCADLNIYDSLGNHLGYNSTSGFVDTQIPDSIYIEDGEGVQYALLYNLGTYRIELIGKGNGDFHLHVQMSSEEAIVLDEWINGTTSSGAIETHHLYVPPNEPPMIDDTPPSTHLTIGNPKSVVSTRTYVTKDTSFMLQADDGAGSGVAETAYRVFNCTYDIGWTHCVTQFTLASLSDGTYSLFFNSTDNAGNVEQSNTVTIVIDNTPPSTSLAIGDPKYSAASSTFVTSNTPFSLSKTDGSGSGVASTFYRIWNSTYNSGWLPYSTSFYVTTIAN